MTLTSSQLMLIEQRVTNDGPSSTVAWLLWLFLGFLGAHRFYLGRTGTGILMLLTLGGLFVWWFIDLFLISGMIRSTRDQLRQRLTMDALAIGAAADGGPPRARPGIARTDAA